tara:strand:+ start:74 stop:289 length:216 start_codon:yes stop_codon:yes gene_type:complete
MRFSDKDLLEELLKRRLGAAVSEAESERSFQPSPESEFGVSMSEQEMARVPRGPSEIGVAITEEEKRRGRR